MSAQIISLADRRRVRIPTYEQHLANLDRLAEALEGGARLFPAAPRAPVPRKPTTLELIQQVADNLGIDIDAPFRRKQEPKR